MADSSDFMPAPQYGRSLKGFGVNMLVRRVRPVVDFMTQVLEATVVYSNADFAVLEYQGQQWMLHGDHTYHSNPLLGLVGDGAVRGAGLELHLYGIDPDAAEARARARGDTVLQPAQDKPHGLREAYLVDPEGYVWVVSVASQD